MTRWVGILLLLAAACTGAADADDVTRRALDAVAGGAVLIDVRTPGEFAQGHLPGALNIPHGDIVEGVNQLDLDPGASVVLYCRSGNRSGMAERSLREAGYSQTLNAGGFVTLSAAWESEREHGSAR